MRCACFALPLCPSPQTVYELQDGSALFVTVAKYQTPAGTEIDLKGKEEQKEWDVRHCMVHGL